MNIRSRIILGAISFIPRKAGKWAKEQLRVLKKVDKIKDQYKGFSISLSPRRKQ